MYCDLFLLGKKKINPLDYVEPRDLVSIRKNTTDYLNSTKAIIDLRPEKLAEAITPETQKLFEKQFGRYKEVENKVINQEVENYELSIFSL